MGYDLAFEVSDEVTRFVEAHNKGAALAASSAPTDPLPQLPWRLRAEASGGGLVMDVGAHVVDLLEYLLGPIVGELMACAGSLLIALFVGVRGTVVCFEHLHPVKNSWIVTTGIILRAGWRGVAAAFAQMS